MTDLPYTQNSATFEAVPPAGHRLNLSYVIATDITVCNKDKKGRENETKK
jgi:hypothetical protein